MRFLFEKGFAPAHAFATFYLWVRNTFKADVVLHFGMHGALEFMPAKRRSRAVTVTYLTPPLA